MKKNLLIALVLINYGFATYAMETNQNTLSDNDEPSRKKMRVEEPVINDNYYTPKELAIIEILTNYENIHDASMLLCYGAFASKSFKECSGIFNVIKDEPAYDKNHALKFQKKRKTMNYVPATIHKDKRISLPLVKTDDKKLRFQTHEFERAMAGYSLYMGKIFAKVANEEIIPSWQESGDLLKKIHAKNPAHVLIPKEDTIVL